MARIEGLTLAKVGCHCWRGGCPRRQGVHLWVSRRHVEVCSLECLRKGETCSQSDQHRQVGARWEGAAVDEATLGHEELEHAQVLGEGRVDSRWRPNSSSVLDALQDILLDLRKHVIHRTLLWRQREKARCDVAHVSLDR